eukprot:TRINITY_DN9555_c0_g1_i1.p1 TRINITY_DN9555_c0_g1~~TRINITY_DN9555_c0_g1_i1.p1  ORF type:complete len:480 (-),score=95.17 TRINITY_DN9555_c0_g1_i1:98-1537(-)
MVAAAQRWWTRGEGASQFQVVVDSDDGNAGVIDERTMRPILGLLDESGRLLGQAEEGHNAAAERLARSLSATSPALVQELLRRRGGQEPLAEASATEDPQPTLEVPSTVTLSSTASVTTTSTETSTTYVGTPGPYSYIPDGHFDAIFPLTSSSERTTSLTTTAPPTTTLPPDWVSIYYGRDGSCLTAAANDSLLALSCAGRAGEQWNVSDGKYRSRASGRCLEAASNHRDARLAPCSNAASNQIWIHSEDGQLQSGHLCLQAESLGASRIVVGSCGDYEQRDLAWQVGDFISTTTTTSTLEVACPLSCREPECLSAAYSVGGEQTVPIRECVPVVSSALNGSSSSDVAASSLSCVNASACLAHCSALESGSRWCGSGEMFEGEGSVECGGCAQQVVTTSPPPPPLVVDASSTEASPEVEYEDYYYYEEVSTSPAPADFPGSTTAPPSDVSTTTTPMDETLRWKKGLNGTIGKRRSASGS